LHLLVTVVLYRRVQKYGPISLFCMLYYLLFTPLDTMSVTYNAIALASFALFGTYFLTERTTLGDITAGIILAMGVVASPYTIMVYGIYAVSVMVIQFTGLKRSSAAACPVFSLKSFLWITAGSAAMAVVFCGYLVSVGLEQILATLPYLLAGGNGGIKFPNLIRGLISHDGIQVTLGLALILVSSLDKKRYERSLVYFSLQTVVWVISMIGITTVHYMRFNVLMLPISVLGLQAFVLTKKKDYNLFFSLWAMGLLFALVSSESSDTGILVFSMGMVLSGMAGILFIAQFAGEFENRSDRVKNGVIALVCIIFFFQMGCQSFVRLTRTYWDESLFELRTEITRGAGRGIRTTKGYAQRYEEIYDDLQLIKAEAQEDDAVLIARLFPSAYLDLDMNYGTFSSWTYYNNRNKYDEFTDQLSSYYEAHPEKLPEYIYVEDEEPEQLRLLDQVVDLDGYKIIQGKQGLIFAAKGF